MLDHLKSLAIFSQVVDTGSFRGAAKILNLSPSVVSQHVSKLEKHIGAALLYRSTRAISLTNEGERLHSYTKQMVRIAEDSMDLFTDEATQRLVDLRIAIPATLTANPVFVKLTDFAKQHPGIKLTVTTSDKPLNLLRDAIDVAIRMGHFADSEMKSKTIGNERAVLVATPEYIASQPELKSPVELQNWDFISFLPVSDRVDINQSGKRSYPVWGRTVGATDSIETLRMLCLAGLGLGLIPYSNVRHDLKAGTLKQVLPHIADKPLPIVAVWPRNAALNATTRTFIRALSAGQEPPT